MYIENDSSILLNFRYNIFYKKYSMSDLQNLKSRKSRNGGVFLTKNWSILHLQGT